jgi:hypothetical protein
LELQVRSDIQHYWAEAIEKTSVVYGRYLKEMDGEPEVLYYFKLASDIFYDKEMGNKVDAAHKVALKNARIVAQSIIDCSSTRQQTTGPGDISTGVIKQITDKASHNPAMINNWLLVFNWTYGTFVDWSIASRNPEEAVAQYVEAERKYPQHENWEVVLVGSSDISTIYKTHSHYFGVDADQFTLEGIEAKVIGDARSLGFSASMIRIISVMEKQRYWGGNTVRKETLKSHFCQDVQDKDFEATFADLGKRGWIKRDPKNGAYSLQTSAKNEILAVIG